ncbi:POK11 protein, partial [Drymodes brunneopygia]|nr:POK11 protein [Drymodes brunneopygia]
KNYTWVCLPKYSPRPLKEGLTVFTDVGKTSQKAATVWNTEGYWQQHILEAEPGDSLQTLELAAVCWAVTRWCQQEINIVMDSLYVAGVVQQIEDAVIRETQNECLL